MENIIVYILVATILFLIIHSSEKNFENYETWINYRQEPLGNN